MSKRRGRGEGSIYQRPDKSWVASVYVGCNGAGKRLRKTVYGATKKEVQEKLAKLQNSKLDGTLSDTSRLTVAAYLDRWFNAIRSRLDEGSFSNYERTIRLRINPRIGGLQLAKLTPLHIQGLYSKMEQDGESSEKKRMTHFVLNNAFKQAIKWGLLTRNVCAAVDRPKTVSSKAASFLDAEQAAALLEAIKGDRLEALYVVALTTGMRLGEIMGLPWSSVDFVNGAILVNQSLAEVKGRQWIGLLPGKWSMWYESL